MKQQADRSGPIDVLLANGGHVIIAFGDADACAEASSDGVISALVHADGTEADLERAIVAEATADGLDVRVSRSTHPTTLIIESRSSN